MGGPVRVIEDRSLRVTSSGFEIRVRFKWYRSLPLSCLENLRMSIDGCPIDASLITLEVNGRRHRLEQLVEQVEETWFVLDPAVLSVGLPGRVRRGETYHLKVFFGLRAPYIPVGPAKFLTIVNECSVDLVAG